MRKTLVNCLLAAAPACVLADNELIDEIAVTATPLPARQEAIASSLSVVSGADVSDGVLTTDALRSATGVVIQQTTPGQGAAIIRGLKGSSILHVVDGMRLNNAIFRSAPTQYLALVPATSIERIEVIRGTPAALYGSEAVGGVVQVLTHQPDFDSEELEARGSTMLRYDSAELMRSLGATVDAGNRRLAASLSAEYATAGNRRTGSGDRIGPSGYTSKAARAWLGFNPADDETWSFDVQFLEQPETPRTDELVPGFGQTEPSSSEFFFEPNERLFAHLQHRNRSGPFGHDWRFDISWQRIVDDRRTRDFGSDIRTFENNRSDLFGADLRVAGQAGETTWVIGAELYHDEVRSARVRVDTVTGGLQTAQSRFPDGSKIRQAAIYGSLNRPLAERQRISAGLRFSGVDISVPESGSIAAASIDANRMSGDLGWILGLTEHWQVVANLGMGFRAPNIFDIGTLGNRPGNRFNIPNTSLGPETVVHIDAGLRYYRGGTRFEFMYYTLDYEDRITSVLTGDVTADGRDVVQSVNAASTSIYGIEAGLDVSLGADVTLHANAVWTRGEQTIGGLGREPADRIPPLTGRVSLTWHVRHDWELDAWLFAAGEQDRMSARDTRDVRIDPLGTPGWSDLGASATWMPGDEWQLRIGLENLLDKRYRQHGSGIDAAGRSLTLLLRHRW